MLRFKGNDVPRNINCVTIVVRTCAMCRVDGEEVTQMTRCRAWISRVFSNLIRNDRDVVGSSRGSSFIVGLRQSAAFARYHAAGSREQMAERRLVAASGVLAPCTVNMASKKHPGTPVKLLS
jgi:hypothetical protein